MNSISRQCILGASLVLFIHAAHAATYNLCSVTGGCQHDNSYISVKNSYTKTQYPLVFAHGLNGFSKNGTIDYWYQIPQSLVSGGSDVYVTLEAAQNSSEVRGEQLLSQVKQILAISGAKKINLIGHSHGGQSVRYVAAVVPSQVASVTTVGSPHTGSPLFDAKKAKTTPPLVTNISNMFFEFFDLMSGEAYQQDKLAAIDSLTTLGAAKFNLKFPQALPAADNRCGEGAYQVNGVRYYSWGGTGLKTNLVDFSDYFLADTSKAFKESNDGVVGRCSSHLGQVIRDDFFMNHFDEVNQLFGMVSIFATSPITVYRNQANRLKNAGL